MPSRKGYEQAITWLKNKIAEKDTLDSINAEVCLNVIMDLKRKREALGAIYCQSKISEKRMKEHIKEIEAEKYWYDIPPGFIPVKIDNIDEIFPD